MGKLIVETVVDALCEAGIRAQRTMPGTRMPALQSLAAAVQLQQLDQAAETATVLVSVLVPAVLGAGSCEDGALEICQILQSAGGICRQGRTEYLSSVDLFCTDVSAVFAGRETADGWKAPEAPVTFSVQLGEVTLSSAVSFTARREMDETVTALSDAVWYFQLEEVFPLDAQEETAPKEPFSITVSRLGQTEVYSGCAVTAQKRAIRSDGQHQIREGTATERTVSE